MNFSGKYQKFNRQACWKKADLHLHTTFSDGLMTPEEVVTIIATETDLNLIAITDHDTTEGAVVAQHFARRHSPYLKVVVGQEVTTGDGDVIGLFLQNSLPPQPTALAAINAIHRQGGLAVAVHPFAMGFDMHSVGNLITQLPFDAIETRHGCPLSILSNIISFWLNRRGQQLPALGSSDAHIPFVAGQAFTWYRGDLRTSIQTGIVRPGGGLWKISSMLRKVPVILERGITQYKPGRQPVSRTN